MKSYFLRSRRILPACAKLLWLILCLPTMAAYISQKRRNLFHTLNSVGNYLLLSHEKRTILGMLTFTRLWFVINSAVIFTRQPTNYFMWLNSNRSTWFRSLARYFVLLQASQLVLFVCVRSFNRQVTLSIPNQAHFI